MPSLVGAQKFVTTVKKTTTSPSWNECFEAIIEQKFGPSLQLEVWDEDKGLKDDELGCNACHHPVVKLTHHMRETFRTAECMHDFPQPVAIKRVKGYRQIHEGSLEVSPHLLALLLQLSSSEDHVDCSSVSSEATLAFR
ncbi:unnamed protein product [Schistocephalus solidus]|uniref:C2 domain-containing protein n=1 Tax=Schistocephalus solidus TaxID=70667 RepID=A0A183SI10_SCHSO|nr:unnamed protein product [Schistocephalus solidus]